MTTLLGSILSLDKNSTNIFSQNIVGYLFGLILTTGRKNYCSIAREHDISYDVVYGISKEYDQIPILQSFLIQNIQDQLSNGCKQGKLIIDFTLVHPFAYTI